MIFQKKIFFSKKFFNKNFSKKNLVKICYKGLCGVARGSDGWAKSDGWMELCRGSDGWEFNPRGRSRGGKLNRRVGSGSRGR